MSARRLEKLDADRQQRLFNSAAEEFTAHGFDGASLNRILEQSGISKSSLYYYFEDKADLFTTLVERSIAFLIKEMGGLDPETLTAQTFWSTFEDLYRRGIAVTDKNAWLIRFGGMFYQLRSNPKKGSATNRLFQSVRGWVEIILSRGRVLGVVRSDIPLSLLVDSTLALLESLDRWVVTHWNSLSDDEKARLPETHIDLFRRLLSAQG